jgi:hypothetical protein
MFTNWSLPLRALHPQDVVEEKLVVVGRGETFQAQVRPMHHHLAQAADFGIDA